MDPNDCFLRAISSCGTVSSSNSITKKTIWADWRPHITPLLYKVYLPITEGFVELEQYVSCTNACVSVICKYIHRHSAVRVRQANIWSSLFPACKVCIKPSWSCMGSTMLAAPLKWGWEEDVTGDWSPLWTTPSELTKCNCKWAVPVTVIATKPHKNEQSFVHICWPV